MITCLQAEQNEARRTEEECENKLMQFEKETCELRKEAREQKAEVGRLKRRVRRFGTKPLSC